GPREAMGAGAEPRGSLPTGSNAVKRARTSRVTRASARASRGLCDHRRCGLAKGVNLPKGFARWRENAVTGQQLNTGRGVAGAEPLCCRAQRGASNSAAPKTHCLRTAPALPMMRRSSPNASGAALESGLVELHYVVRSPGPDHFGRSLPQDPVDHG